MQCCYNSVKNINASWIFKCHFYICYVVVTSTMGCHKTLTDIDMNSNRIWQQSGREVFPTKIGKMPTWSPVNKKKQTNKLTGVPKVLTLSSQLCRSPSWTSQTFMIGFRAKAGTSHPQTIIPLNVFMSNSSQKFTELLKRAH